MNAKYFFEEELKNRYGVVKRARGCFLYTEKGVRLTDMWQEGGRAILGWGGSPFTVFKNTLNRGITGSYATHFEPQVKRAVEKLLGYKCEVFVFSDKMAALKAALTFSKTGTSFWKPWSVAQSKSAVKSQTEENKAEQEQIADIPDGNEKHCVIIEPPLPWTQNIFILAVDTEIFEVYCALAAQGTVTMQNIAAAIPIPAPLSAAIARSIYDIIAELPKRTEKDWFGYDKIICKYWERKGPYLFPKIPVEKYDAFLLHCLDCRLVASPSYNVPSIVPFGANIGVFDSLKKNEFVLA